MSIGFAIVIFGRAIPCRAAMRTSCKRANFLLLISKHVVKGLIGGYVGASSVAETDFRPYGNIGQVVKAVIALNVNDEKISHGLQLRHGQDQSRQNFRLKARTLDLANARRRGNSGVLSGSASFAA